MTFKELTIKLQEDGWRAYLIPDAQLLVRKNLVRRLALLNLRDVLVYENQNIVFVKTIHPPEEKEDIEDKNKDNE